MHPRLRHALQRLATRAERVTREVRSIHHGDPMASSFAAFGPGSRIDAPHIGLGIPACVSIGSNVEIRSYLNIETFAPPGRVVLSVGDGSIIGHHVRFVALNGIELGELSGIGHGCTLTDTVHDWHAGDPDRPPWETPLSVGPPLRVEPGAWIGNNCVLMGGITIGARAIVGANSVVTRNVPPDTVVAGNPARLSGTTAAFRRFYASRVEET